MVGIGTLDEKHVLLASLKLKLHFSVSFRDKVPQWFQNKVPQWFQNLTMSIAR